VERIAESGKQHEPAASAAGRGRDATPSSSSLPPALQLQQSAGNQAMQGLLRSGFIQAKLAISNPDDPDEREADNVANTIMRKAAGAPASSPCSCSHDGEMCEECQQKQSAPSIQRRASSSAAPTHVPRIVSDVLRSPGHPLDSATRAFFEPRFGRDFSDVRVHTGAEAAASARSINAHAYTAGSNIVFASDRYAPETTVGERLLAHELTHVLQQQIFPPSASNAASQAPSDSVGSHREAQQGPGVDLDKARFSVAHRLGPRIARDATPSAADANRDSQVACVGRRGGCLNERGGGVPSDEEIGRYNLDCRRETKYSGPDVTPTFEECLPAGAGKIHSKTLAEAIEGGWRDVIELDDKSFRIATVEQRVAMLTALIQAYWTGGAEEEAILKILSLTPLVQSQSLVKYLTEHTLDGKSYFAELHRVVDFGNNLELHRLLSELRLKAIGPEKGTEKLQSAPILPWHDVMGFFETPAVFELSRTAYGKIVVDYPTTTYVSKEFGPELSNLHYNIFDPDQVFIIHDYDKGAFIPIVAQELLGYEGSGIRNFLDRAANVASLVAPVSAARTAVGKGAVVLLEKLLPAAFLLIDENRLNIVKWWPKWGPRMIQYADLAKFGVGIYGIGRFAVTGWRLFQSWKEVRRSRAAFEAIESVGLPPGAENLALTLERQADEIFAEVDRVNSEGGAASVEGAPLGPAESPTPSGKETHELTGGQGVGGKTAPRGDEKSIPELVEGPGVSTKGSVGPEVLQPLVGTRGSTFRAKVAAIIRGDKSHPLKFLLGSDGKLRPTTTKGLTHDILIDRPDLVEAGHVVSAKAGQPDRLILMSAWKNRILSSTIEHPSKGGSFIEIESALNIGGIAVDLELAKDWVNAGFLNADVVAAAARIQL